MNGDGFITKDEIQELFGKGKEANDFFNELDITSGLFFHVFGYPIILLRKTELSYTCFSFANAFHSRPYVGFLRQYRVRKIVEISHYLILSKFSHIHYVADMYIHINGHCGSDYNVSYKLISRFLSHYLCCY